MADHKEYEMLFKLSAQLGQDFNGTFSSAQKTLAATQKEIQSLNKLQSDISAYTKQQNSVDSLRSKLSVYQQQLQNVQQEIAASGEYNSTLANKELELKQRIEQTEASIKQKSETLDRMSAELSEAGVDMSRLSEEAQRLGAEVEDLKSKEEQAAEEAQNFGDVGANSAMAVGEALAAAGIATLLKEIYEAYGECVTGAAAFGDEIGTVSVQYGIAAQDLQAYYYAAELVDVSVETLTSTMARNVRAMSYAQDGTARYVEAYEQLGVSVTNADGSLRDSEDVYWDVIDALREMDNASERDAIAMELLGRSAQQINTLIAAGSGVMEEYKQQAEDAGYVMDEQMLASVMALDDELQIQNNNMTALKNTIGAAYAPELTKLLQIWNEMLADMTQFAEENPAVVKTLIALGLELATIVGIYGGYVAIKKTANALKALSAALTAKEAVATGAHTAATVAQTTATGAATVAQTGLNAAMMANPVGLIATAIMGLTVGIGSLIAVMKEETDASEEMTAASKAEQEQLQALSEEYDIIVEKHGEASYQAQELAWEIEELSAQYEENKQTMGEYREEFDDVMSEYSEMVALHKEEAAQLDLESEKLFSLISRLEALSSQTQISAADQQEMLAIINALNEAVPDLSLSYNDLANNVGSSIEAIKALAEAELASREYDQLNDQLIGKMGQRVSLSNQLAIAQYNQAAAEEKLIAKTKEYEAWYERNKHAVGTSSKKAGQMGEYWAEIRELTEAYNEFTQDVANAEQAIKNNEAAIESTAEKMAGLSAITEEAGDNSAESAQIIEKAAQAVSKGYLSATQAANLYGVSVTKVDNKVAALEKETEELATALKSIRSGFLTADEAAVAFGYTIESLDAYKNIVDITDEITALSEAYQEAYDSAYESISSQYELWDMAAKVIPTSIEDINNALQSQTAYWYDYNVDLESLTGRADEIDGLSEMLASFADGSEKSVNAVAGMAQASDEELREMVDNWRLWKDEQDNIADSITNLDSNYQVTLGNLEKQLEGTIQELNLAEEAQTAAKETMDAYIKALKEGAGEASIVAQQLATQIGSSLNAANSAGGSGADAGGSGGTSGGSAGGIGGGESSIEELIAAQIVQFGNASGRGMNAGKSGDNGVITWNGEEYKVQNSGNAYGSSDNIYKAAVEVLGFADRQIFGYNGKVYGYLDGHIQEIEGRTMSKKGYEKFVSAMQANYGSYHTGGLVGDVATLSESEEFAKLLKGEFVSTPAQMEHFMQDTLPQIASYQTISAQPVDAQPVPFSSQLPPINVSYQIEISGDHENIEERLRRVLEEHDRNLADTIEDVIFNRESDLVRTSYR